MNVFLVYFQKHYISLLLASMVILFKVLTTFTFINVLVALLFNEMISYVKYVPI
jgi:hypothetical protein